MTPSSWAEFYGAPTIGCRPNRRPKRRSRSGPSPSSKNSGRGAGALSTLIAQALASADIASLLVRSGDTYCYFLAVPNRFENAATLRRHPAFSSGWCAHLAALRDKVGAGAPHSTLIAFAFFLDPDGGESLLQLSFVEKAQMRVPTSMLDARAARTEEVEPLDLSMEFKLAA